MDLKVLNQCRVNYSYQPNPNEPLIRKNVYSNVVKTAIIQTRLKVTKQATAKTTTYLQVLTYELVIENTSCFHLNHLQLDDDLSSNARYLIGSFCVNNEPYETACTQLHHILLPPLQKYGVMKLTFQVEVCICECDDVVTNTGMITYDHYFADDQPPLRMTILSNTVKTPITSRIVQDLLYSVCFCCLTPCYHLKDVSLVQTKVIHTSVPMIEVWLKLTYQCRQKRIVCCHRVMLICTKDVHDYEQVDVYLVEYNTQSICCHKQRLTLEFVLVENESTHAVRTER